MITGTLRNKVDAVWDTLWTGGITSPITVLEQITYLMFMKLLDDKQLKAEATAHERDLAEKVFGEGVCVISETPRVEMESRKLRWHVFRHLEPAAMLEHIRNYVFPFIKSLGCEKNSAFCRFMKDAVFLIPSGHVLAKVVNGIEALAMNDRDLMGDVYEYLLSKIAVSGVNGQFRTPRHIIDLMVQLVKPTLADRVLDPAMGSAGFLQRCAAYIREHQGGDLSPPRYAEYYGGGLFSGFDTDQSMLRIGSMNMMLHGVAAPGIRYLDALSSENEERSAYSLILANPPFKGNVFRESISADLTSLCPTAKTELLFMALIMKMLAPGGRCASIVPDGVLFAGSKAHKALRKELVENMQLRAVISLPAGVFRPYAGVSTAILIFNRSDFGSTDKVWFYDMQADGFSLDDKRTPIAQNDIPDIIARFGNLAAEASRQRSERSFFVSKREIVENEYDLSINKYKKIPLVPVEYPPTADILDNIERLESQIQTDVAALRKLLEKRR